MEKTELHTKFVNQASHTQKVIDETWDNYQFDGFTLSEWDDKLFCPIPKSPSSDDMRAIFGKIGEAVQLTTGYYSICNSVYDFLVFIQKNSFDKKITQIVDDYKNKNAKRPARQIIESLALESLEDVNLQVQIFKVLRNYWKDKKEAMVELRKNAEQIQMATALELKYFNNG